jgi:hypothetical protein
MTSWSGEKEEAFLRYLETKEGSESGGESLARDLPRSGDTDDDLDALMDSLEVVRGCQETIIQKLNVVSAKSEMDLCYTSVNFSPSSWLGLITQVSCKAVVSNSKAKLGQKKTRLNF